MSLLRSFATLLLCSLLAACATSPYSPESREASKALIHEQAIAAAHRIGSEPISVIYAGYALHNGSTAFQGDILAMSALVNRMTKGNVQLLFSNVQGPGQAMLPYATEYDFDLGMSTTAALADVERKRSGKAPLVVVLLTSHGTTDNLIVNAAGDNLTMSSARLARDFKVLEQFPTLLIISACHSGSLIPALQNDNRIIMTASSADRVSFGCQANGDRTWFIDSMFKAFEPERTLQTWYEMTAQNVALKEKETGFEASQPQLWVGKNMERYANAQLGQLAQEHLTAIPTKSEQPPASLAPKE